MSNRCPSPFPCAPRACYQARNANHLHTRKAPLMFSFTSTAKTAVAGAAIAAAVALPLLTAPAAFAIDACFAPTAVPDSYSVVQNASITVDAASGTLSNDASGGCPDFVMDGATVVPEGTL